ncbi:glycoside hydrolase family 1 protein [Altererythrobacter sp. SALINAS58]|uniref:glycoside hydrolase family 1 protein n=1 Tax=Alteripontixanthobacter muriae TaxID=2705546 RepID=UPI0015776C62|nr:family 1 glycosylhydrolase [Alteripontixanthobacter muriae]NTZ43187.1 glycoside hydrolase family 1 protein [Alteripontixanthobacter muriae]
MTAAFPANFIWGSATAAHQVEGSNFNSDCWALEHARPSLFREPSGDAVDQWNRFADDVALLAALGLTSYRFSIEWARVEPNEGEFSTAALDHYQRCIDACLQRGIEPIITLHHFTAPIWLARKGGMTSSEFPERFARYCEHCVRALKGFSIVCTLNELNVPLVVREKIQSLISDPSSQSAVKAAEAALGSPLTSMFLFTPEEALLSHGLAAHAMGRDAIKSVRPEVQVGVTLAIQDEVAAEGGEAHRDRRIAETITPFLEAARGDDFIGVQNYTRIVSQSDGSAGPEPGHPLTVMGYEDRPQALAQVCRYVWEQTQTPIIVTESGWAGDDDRRRQAFIEEVLEELHGAITDGVDVRGFYYWSLLDNFEWLAGYGPRFGLVDVNRTSQRRYIKPSAIAYGAIARRNGLPNGDRSTANGSRHLLSGSALGI